MTDVEECVADYKKEIEMFGRLSSKNCKMLLRIVEAFLTNLPEEYKEHLKKYSKEEKLGEEIVKTQIEKITVEINREEAKDICNAIEKSIENKTDREKDYPQAIKFQRQLLNIFFNSVNGIHF